MRIIRGCASLVLTCVWVALILSATSCCTRNPDKIPPSDSVRHFGRSASHWLLVQINPIAGVENHGLKRFVVCRFQGETSWVIKLNSGYFQYRYSWGHYTHSAVDHAKLNITYDSKKEPIGRCKYEGKDIRFLDVDALKLLIPQMDMLIVDDGKTGFLVKSSTFTEWTIWEYTTFRFGGGALTKEADTVTSLLQEQAKQ